MRGTQVEQARRTCSVFFSPSSNNYCPAPTKATSQTLSLVRQKGATAVKNERIQVDYKINEQDILEQFRVKRPVNLLISESLFKFVENSETRKKKLRFINLNKERKRC